MQSSTAGRFTLKLILDPRSVILLQFLEFGFLLTSWHDLVKNVLQASFRLAGVYLCRATILAWNLTIDEDLGNWFIHHWNIIISI